MPIFTKRRPFMLLALGGLILLGLGGCSAPTAPPEAAEEETFIFYTEQDLNEIAPGVFILHKAEGMGFHLQLQPARFTEASFAVLERMKAELLGEVQPTAILGAQRVSPEMKQELLRALEDALKVREILPQLPRGVRPQGIFCSATASAMPTTAALGVKAYSRVDCGWHAFNARARAYARAGSTVDRPSPDEGIAHARNTAVAYLPATGGSCESFASASGYVTLWNNVNYLDAYAYNEHNACI